MAARKNTIKGEVTLEWVNKGKPAWSVKETRRMCILMDNKLARRNKFPAIKFHEAVQAQDKIYIRTWVMGCHFQWLNPR